jgi:hypothetical protein
MCRYIPERELPNEASDDVYDAITRALEIGDYTVMENIKRYLRIRWGMNEKVFAKVILAHLSNGYRIFEKYIETPKPRHRYYDGNIAMDYDAEDSSTDIYVEIRVRDDNRIFFCDAHGHTPGTPRLQK